MAAPTLIRRELANAEVCFIPNGETVDSVTVAVGTWPDNVPPTNFTNYALPDVEKVVMEKGVVDEEFMIPDANGGYFADNEQMVTNRKWVITTAKTSNFIKQLDKGLAAAVVAATPQAHGTKQDNFLFGILRITELSKAGATLEVTQVWAKMRVRSSGETGPATRKIEVEFQQYASSLNTVTVS